MVKERSWLDNQMSNFLRDAYNKEERQRHDFIDKWEKDHPTNDVTIEEDVREPSTKEKIQAAAAEKAKEKVLKILDNPVPESCMGFRIGQRLTQQLVPNYSVNRHGFETTSQAAFIDDPEKEDVNRMHFRKRDKFTDYVEASARYKLLTNKSTTPA